MLLGDPATGGGDLAVRAAAPVLDDKMVCDAAGQLTDAGMVVIEVADTGVLVAGGDEVKL